MNPSKIYAEINSTFLDWDGLLANPRYCRDGNFVSWTNFSGGRLKEPVTLDQILDVVEKRQFTFQSAEDGSIFQILYSFSDAGVLQVARLAFYLLKVKGSFEEGTAELASCSWIRFDYDLPAATGLLHNACHLHMHGFPEARIIVDGVPGPRQFVELAIAMCYPELYKVHRLNGVGEFQDRALPSALNACSIPRTSSIRPPIIHLALGQG